MMEINKARQIYELYMAYDFNIFRVEQLKKAKPYCIIDISGGKKGEYCARTSSGDDPSLIEDIRKLMSDYLDRERYEIMEKIRLL